MKLSQLSLADYNQLDSIPVINQDLSATDFTPVANTYYRHTGATTDTFTLGVIYLYDTAYHKLGESGGGISDIKVDGTSVVTNGVTNIPPASDNVSGVVTTGTQTFTGRKNFYSSIVMMGASINFRTASNGKTISFKSLASDTYSGIYSYADSVKRQMRYQLYGAGKSEATTSGDASSLIIEPDYENCLTRIHGSYGTSVAMFAPSTWSSGTSGSVTLTKSGTYQIYMNDGKNNINFGVVYWDGSADTYTQAVFDSAHSGYFATIVGGVITAFDLSITGDSTTANTNTIYYRRIGI